jgi:hypothetical protein
MFTKKGVNRWKSLEIEIEIVAGARDAVAARTTAENAGVAYGVHAAAVAVTTNAQRYWALGRLSNQRDLPLYILQHTLGAGATKSPGPPSCPYSRKCLVLLR